MFVFKNHVGEEKKDTYKPLIKKAMIRALVFVLCVITTITTLNFSFAQDISGVDPMPGDTNPIVSETGIMATDGILDMSDLTNFLTSFEFRDLTTGTLIYSIDNAGNVSGDPVAVQGQNYTFVMTFAETPAGAQFDPNGNLTYQIPSGLSILNTTNPTPLYNDSHVQIGTFTITGNLVTVTPDPSYQTPGTDAWNFWTNDENAHFYITATGCFSSIGSGESGAIKIDFGNNILPDINIDPGKGNITVNKSLSDYNPVTHTMNATVTYTADPNGGSVLIDQLTDVYALGNAPYTAFSGNLGLGSEVSLMYTSADGETSYPVTGSIGSSTSVPVSTLYTYGTSGDQFTITDLSPAVTLKPGDKLVMTYTLQVKDSYVQGLLNSASKTNSSVIYSGYLSNYASVDAHDLMDNPVSGSTSVSKYLSGTILSKAAGSVGDGTVAWSATVGDGYSNLGGVPITDTLTSGATFTGTFTVDLFYNNNGVLTKLGTETFTAGTSGTSSPVFAPESGVIVTGSDNGSITWNGSVMTYTPPTSLSVNGNPVTQAKLSYVTTLPTPGAGNPTGSITNTIDLTTYGADIAATAKVSPASGGAWSINKSGQLKSDANGPYMQYTIMAKVPSVFYNNNLYLTDSTGGQNNGRITVMYYDDLSDSGSPPPAIYTSPLIDMNRLLDPQQVDLTVNVYDLSGTSGSGSPTLDSLDLSKVNLATLSPYKLPSSVFNTSAPDYTGTPQRLQDIQVKPGDMTSQGSWNVIPMGYTRSDWAMTFGSASGAGSVKAATVSPSFDASGSVWPVDVDSLLVVSYKVYLSSNALDSANRAWSSLSGVGGVAAFSYQGSFNTNTFYNTAYLNSNTAVVGTQYGANGMISKSFGPSWGNASSMPLVLNGQYYFPYNTKYLLPYLTELQSPPVFTDTFDQDLAFAPDDPNTYFYVALHFQPLKDKTVYDMLITVPASQVTVDGNKISVNMADLENDHAALYSHANQYTNIDYSGAPLYVEDSPQACYADLKQAVTDFLQTQSADTSVVSLMPDDWYALNNGSAGLSTLTDSPGLAGVKVNTPSPNTNVASPNPYCVASYYTVDYLLTFAGGKTLPDDVQNGVVKNMVNNAAVTVTPKDGVSFDLNGTATYPFQIQPIGKNIPTTNSTMNNNNVVNVNVNLNPYALAMMEGSANTYEAVDTMTNLMYLTGTLNVCQINPAQGAADVTRDANTGALTIAAPTNAPSASKQPKAMRELTAADMDTIQGLILDNQPIPDEYQYSFYVDTNGDVYFYLPDGSQFEIDYQAMVNANTGQTVDFSNAVSITGTGFAYTATKTGIVIADASGQGSSSRQPVTLVKEDASDSGKTLDGAVFALYGPQVRQNADQPPATIQVGDVTYDVESNNSLPVGSVAGTPGLINIPMQINSASGSTYYYYETEVTGANAGTTVFNHPLLIASLNWTYAMQEIVPPAGYAMNTAPTLFALNGTMGTKPTESTVVTLADSSNTLTIDNRPGGGSLTVSKTVAAGGAQDKYFDFVVTQAGAAVDLTGKTISWSQAGMTAETNGLDLTTGAFKLKSGESVTMDGLAPGTYEVTEADASGYTATWTVSGGDTGSGSGEAASGDVVGGGNTAVAFTNTYTAAAGSATIEAKKSVVGAALTSGEFTFALVGSDGKVVDLKANDGSGNVTFDELTYTTTGEYGYKVVECGPTATLADDWAVGAVPGTAAANGSGWTYDGSEKDVTVTVSDGGVGQLVAAVDYSGSTTPQAFTNTYLPAPVDLPLSGEKTLMGYNDTPIAITAGQFTFTMTPDANNPVGVTWKADASGTPPVDIDNIDPFDVKADGTIDFGLLNFIKAGIYLFTISENDNGDNGYVYDPNPVTVTVEVIDNNGELEVSGTTYEKNGVAADGISFDNTQKWYDAALRKWITAVNGDATPDDVVASNTTANAGTPSQPVVVKPGDIVEYTIRVFNQCPYTMCVPAIVDDLPDGLLFAPSFKAADGTVYSNDGWSLITAGSQDDQADTGKDYLKFTYPDTNNDGLGPALNGYDGTAKTSTGENAYDYTDVKVYLKVSDSAAGIVTNTAKISKETDENGKVVDDIDSIPGDDTTKDTVKDNEIEEHGYNEDGTINEGNDADDHDIAQIIVAAISVEVSKDTIKRTSAAFDGSADDVTLNGQVVDNVGVQKEQYRYDINFRSTSNVDGDEFVVDDPLESVRDGYVRVEGFWTPAVWGDKDGRMNVWYKSTMAPVGTSPTAPSGVNAITKIAPADQVFPTDQYSKSNPDGWKLWTTIDQSNTSLFQVNGVIGRVNLGLPADLDTAGGDYITAIRLEYGAVKVGFTSKNNGDEIGQGSDVPLNTAIDGSDATHPYRFTNGSQAYLNHKKGAGAIDPLVTPQEDTGVNNTPPVIALLASPFQAFSSAIMANTLAAYADQASDIPAKGTTNDWAPTPGRSDYPTNPADQAQLNSLLGTSILKPATYLVSAMKPMTTTDIVSSATANIARGGSAAGMYDQDQDAVLTREIVPFTASTNNPNPGSIVAGNSFVDHAKLAGLTLKNGVWYDSQGSPVKTADAFALNLWIVLAAAALVCFVLLIRTYLVFAPAAARRKKKNSARGKWFMLTMMLALALMIALPATAFAAEPAPAAGGVGTMQIEYRYAEGETPDIQQSIVQYGQTYHLVSQADPVLESALPQTRTYTYRVDGALTPDQLAQVQALGNITLTPEDIVKEREVDKVATMSMRANDVDDIPVTKQFEVTSGTASSGYEVKDLERVGVAFDLANPPYDADGLPAGYTAAAVYRGVETYDEVGYYYAAATFTTTESDGDVPVYVIVASYQTDAIPPQVNSMVPLQTTPPDTTQIPDGYTAMLDSQGANPFANIINGDVPLGGLSSQGVWSFLSMLISAAAVVIALVYATGIAARRARVKTIENIGIYDEERIRILKRRGLILRILTSIIGVLTLVTWLFLDDFNRGMVWINANTPTVAIVFAVTVVMCILTNIRDKNVLGSDSDEEDVSDYAPV